uniref:Uncharacterized protein n=1 Tax=Meloidogyne hapla TaxID=6305 RepID=A0A1I8BPV4_MELHA
MKIPQLPVAELEVDRTLISLTNIKNEQQNQQHPLNNKEVTIINRIKKKSFVDTTNIDKQNIQNISLNDEKRQRRTKLKEKHSLNNVSKDVSENEKEIQQNNKNNKTSNKTLNIKISNKENINVLKSETKVSDSRGKFLSVSSSSSGEAMTSASLNDSVLFNGNQQKHFNFVNKTRKEDRNTSTSEEELEQQKWKKSSNDEDNNSKNDVSNKYSETEETSAESEIPEWADEEEHEKRGIDEDFEQLAAQSASLFNTSKSDDNNDEDSKNNDDINDNKVEKIISKLTKEYRERLLRIYKGRSRIDLRELLTLPPDLSPNISRGDEKSLNCTNEAVPKVDNPPRRKSPGGDFRGKNNKIIEEKTTNYQSGFLFNIKDAVWKPLSEMDVLNPDWSNNKK